MICGCWGLEAEPDEADSTGILSEANCSLSASFFIPVKPTSRKPVLPTASLSLRRSGSEPSYEMSIIIGAPENRWGADSALLFRKV